MLSLVVHAAHSLPLENWPLCLGRIVRWHCPTEAPISRFQQECDSQRDCHYPISPENRDWWLGSAPR